MIKLRDAKCPNCGANIQVNDKLESTICQYCGSQVLIEEAIEQYKIELSGSIEVDGIQGRSSRIRKAKKHIKIGEYAEAKDIFQSLTYENSLDTEAYIELLKVEIMLIRKKGFNTEGVIEDNLNWKKDLTDIRDNYYRIQKIDDEHIAENELVEYQEDVEKYIAYLEKIDDFIAKRDEQIAIERRKEEEKKAQERKEREEKEEQARREKERYADEFKKVSREVVNKMNEYLERASKLSNECCNEYYKMVNMVFKLDNGNVSYIGNNNKYEYFNMNVIGIDELKAKSQILFEGAEPLMQNYVKLKNAQIDEFNKRIDKENSGTFADLARCRAKVLIDWIIIIFLTLITIAPIFMSKDGYYGLSTTICIAIFLDSWAMTLCGISLKYAKDTIRLCEKVIKNNNDKKLKHVS